MGRLAFGGIFLFFALAFALLLSSPESVPEVNCDRLGGVVYREPDAPNAAYSCVDADGVSISGD